MKDGDWIDIRTIWSDEQERRADRFKLVAYDIPRGCLAAYYPETNPLVPLSSVAIDAGTPTSKSIPVVLVPHAAAGDQNSCDTGRITISLTSTSGGCSIANAIARAMASGGTAIASRCFSSCSRTSASLTVCTNCVATNPGETTETRKFGPASLRSPSETARTAVFTPE